MAKIKGDKGRSRVDREVKMAIWVFAGLLMCHCLIRLVEFGGRVIVE